VVNGGELFMFIGEFEYRVDEKGRVPIPPKFRSEEVKKDGVVLCPGQEKCITVYPPSEYNKLADSLISGSIISSKQRKLNRAIFATAFNADLDSQGRIIVPAKLRQYAGIDDAVVVAGANKYIELWGKEQWDTEISNCQEESYSIMESMERRI
jgi:MraZ protein